MLGHRPPAAGPQRARPRRRHAGPSLCRPDDRPRRARAPSTRSSIGSACRADRHRTGRHRLGEPIPRPRRRTRPPTGWSPTSSTRSSPGKPPEMVMVWGITDRHSWVTDVLPRPDGAPSRPLPLDRDLKPKRWMRAPEIARPRLRRKLTLPDVRENLTISFSHNCPVVRRMVRQLDRPADLAEAVMPMFSGAASTSPSHAARPSGGARTTASDASLVDPVQRRRGGLGFRVSPSSWPHFSASPSRSSSRCRRRTSTPRRARSSSTRATSRSCRTR